VHHGIYWKKDKEKNLVKARKEFLLKNNLSLYASHLPLDLHETLGNNAGLAKILKLKNIKKFGSYHKEKIGCKGTLKKATSINKIKNLLNKKLNTTSLMFPFGKKTIKKMGIISGGGAFAIDQVKTEKLDLLITGEAHLVDYHKAKDYEINLIASGHYATETIGVKALIPLLKERFKIPVQFIENKVNL